MDFFIDDGVNWAVELLRNSSGLEEHCNRFRSGGKYENLKSVCSDFMVVNFVCGDVVNLRPNDANFVQISLNPGFDDGFFLYKDSKTRFVLLA